MDPAPFATVVTDLTTCHNTWFYRGVDRCFVPTETCRARALKMGLRPDQVRRHMQSNLGDVSHCAGCMCVRLCGAHMPASLRRAVGLTALAQRRW